LPDSNDPILELRRVCKEFELPGRRVEALHEASLRVSKGEFVCLIGASGCGKSTLLRIAAGFEATTRGQALMSGAPIAGPGPERGMVFQDYGLFPWLNVRRNIAFGPISRQRP
jgi:NitT/TauT family transport system ATP-binding protein